MSTAAGYVPFFSVAVEHGYYADGACPSLDWEPLPATARLMERGGCRAVSSAGQLTVYAEASRLEVLKSCLRDASEPFDLVWRLKPRDLAFDTYTGGVPAERGRVLFLSNTVSVHEGDSNTWRLHSGASVTADDHLLLTDDPLREDARVKGIVKPAERLMRPAPVVRMQLRESDWPADGQAKRYRIRFAAKATLWKYFLFGEWQAAGVEVVDLAQQVNFADAEDENLPNGRAAVTVRSASPIALAHQPTQRFQLRSRQDEGLVLIKRLPAAAPAHTGMAVGGMPVSEIYV